MENKPVAWIDEETTCFVYSQSEYEELSEYDKGGLIPLYTAQRELSDEEISKLWHECQPDIGATWDGTIKFARTILKKASDK
jgi:hypothetical protein